MAGLALVTVSFKIASGLVVGVRYSPTLFKIIAWMNSLLNGCAEREPKVLRNGLQGAAGAVLFVF